ncbi:flagellar hook-length control protein FliK [Pseudomonas chlororaphis]|uniref:Flagellar hook-length control protein FliK n=1 Tax=Pseudomonas chlororaphis TaxID=587753 RepID=A0A1Q8ESV5_9PSED|nr:flagellar hook-length control protein FliK [Pseudomonas chlororaphis]OLF54883.1 flagellar hook-length control protein FliK [Pseudomonas chlororaphis]
MPLTPNMLLQAASQAKTPAASATPQASAAEPGDKGASFARVFAKEASGKPLIAANSPLKPARDKGADAPAKVDQGKDKAAAPAPAVADSGKTLPADKAASSDDKVADDDSTRSDQPLADGTVVDPSVDPALMQATQPVPLPVEPAAAAPEPAPQAQPVVAVLANTAAAVPVDPEFDPEADPLDSLPVVRLAMEQGGHVSASSQTPNKTAPTLVADDGPTSAQTFASGMANMLDLQVDKDSTDQGGEKAFGGLLDDGLKDLKGAASDTRVDDFANRLAALTQAATPKTANAIPVNQPLAMHQSGWTEEVVNRVMYLSAVNLKSADIQLQPAELGRLDIRVNMVPDQQTQVTFMSAHAGVREALEGQMYRLRDMFQQQGMGQVDVNVSDQRNWQGGQEQAQQGQQRSSASTSGGRLDSSLDEELPQGVAEVASGSPTVIGSSAVDYYA